MAFPIRQSTPPASFYSRDFRNPKSVRHTRTPPLGISVNIYPPLAVDTPYFESSNVVDKFSATHSGNVSTTGYSEIRICPHRFLWSWIVLALLLSLGPFRVSVAASPALASPPLTPRSICRGPHHACAVVQPLSRNSPPASSRSQLLCWGNARLGALGGGKGRDADVGFDAFPSAAGYVDLGRDVQPLAVACGERTTCVLVTTVAPPQSMRKALCFGGANYRDIDHYFRNYDSAGTDSAPSAFAVTLMATAVAVIAVGGQQLCVLSTAMELSCTGPSTLHHGYGPGSPQVVLAADLLSRGPVQLGAPALDVACSTQHTCVVTSALRVRCFGVGDSTGRLGYGNEDSIGDNEHPSAAGTVAVGAPVLSLALDYQHACTVTTGLRVRCFGEAGFGALGTGRSMTLGSHWLPSVSQGVQAGAPAIAVAAGDRHSCCITSALQLRCWGTASDGQLGLGYGYGYPGRSEPVSEAGRVPLGSDGASPQQNLQGTGVGRRAVSVSARDTTSCIATTANEVLCWGQWALNTGAACASATPAGNGYVVLGAPLATDPSVIRILWCDSHFGNASTLRSSASSHHHWQQQLASCALGFPFTLALLGTPTSEDGAAVALHATSSGTLDAQCSIQPQPSLPLLCVSRAGSSSSPPHSVAGDHRMAASPNVRLGSPLALQYSVQKVVVPPVTTLALDTSRTPFSTPDALSNRRRLLLLLGSSRPTGARYMFSVDGGSALQSTNSTRLWLPVASEGPHSFTVHTVDAGGVEDPSPLTLRWTSDFTPPSTVIVSGPVQPVTAVAIAHFKFDCSDSADPLLSPCSYRLNLDDNGGGSVSTVGNTADAATDLPLALSPVTRLGVGEVSASAVLAFAISGGRGPDGGAQSTREYRILRDEAMRGNCSVEGSAMGGAGSGGLLAWTALTSRDSLTVGPLADGTYTLQLRGGDAGTSAAVSVAFAVDTTAPRTRVNHVIRSTALQTGSGSSGGSDKAQWDMVVSDAAGGSVAALWWATLAPASDTSTTPRSPPPLQWQRVNVSVGVATVLSPLSATVLRVKAQDAAGSVDPFPRTISWGHALSLQTAPRASTFDSSALFLLSATRNLLPQPLALQWRIDGEPWRAAATSPPTHQSVAVRLSKLPAGPHVFQARPVAANGSPDAVSHRPLTYTWELLSSASLDGSGMTFTDLPDGPHALLARAVDTAGNVDSGNATYRWRIDTTPPLCRAALQSQELAVNGSEPLSSLLLLLDNATAWSSATLTPPTRPQQQQQHVAVRVPPVSQDGAHILRVKATDTAGNTSPLPCAVVAWSVDTTPPVVSLAAPSLGLPPLTNQLAWNVTAVARDVTSRVAALFYSTQRHHSSPPQSEPPPPATTWQLLPLTRAAHQSASGVIPVAAAAGDGPYSLWLKAVDTAGNVAAATAQHSWELDTTAPTLSLLAEPPLPFISPHRWLVACFRAGEPLAALWWRVEAAAEAGGETGGGGVQAQWLPAAAAPRSPMRWCVNGTTAAGSSDGRFVLAVKAEDAAGNTWHDNGVHTWTVDTVAPTACTATTPSLLVNTTAIDVRFGPVGGSGDGNAQGVVSHLYSLSTAATTAAAAAAAASHAAAAVWTSTGGSERVLLRVPPLPARLTSAHVLRVKAVDAAGNVAAHPCASLSWTVDTTPPVTTVHAPPQGTLLRSPPVVSLRHSKAVRWLHWWMDSQPLHHGTRQVLSLSPAANVSAVQSSAAVAPHTDLPDGPHVLWFLARDAAGNAEARAVPFRWQQDSVAPAVWLLVTQREASQSGSLVNSSSGSSSSGGDGGAPRTLAAVAGVRDNNPLVGASSGLWYAVQKLPRLASDGVPLQWTRISLTSSAAQGAGNAKTATVRATVSTDGWFALALKAVDAAGNAVVNASAHRWAVDTTPPTSVIDQAPLNSTLGSGSGLVRFVVRCTAVFACAPFSSGQCPPLPDCVSYRYRVLLASATAASGGSGGSDGCAQESVVIPWTASADAHILLRSGTLRAGSLRFEVKAVDGVGQMQLTAASHTWVASRAQEVVVTLLSAPPPVTAWDHATVVVQATLSGRPFSGQRFQVRVDTESGPWQLLPQCSTALPRCTHVLRGLARGRHSLQARAVDGGSGVPSAAARTQWSVEACNSSAYAHVDSARGGALTCTACPEGADCSPEGSTLQSMGSRPGWWAPAGRSASVTFYRCPLPRSCLGGGNATLPSTCSDTFDRGSALCGSCAASHVRSADACVACPDSGVGVLLLLLCTLLLVAFICFAGTPAPAAALRLGFADYRELASVVQRILLSFLSTLTTIGDFRARGPRLVQQFIGFTSAVSGGLSVRFSPFRCSLGFNFVGELVATLFMPLFLLACCALYAGQRGLMNRQFQGKLMLVECAVFTVFLVYPTLTRATLQVFRCTDVRVEGVRYLLHDLSVQCFRGAHAGALIIAIVATAVVGLGVPLTIISRVAASKTHAERLQLKVKYQFMFDGYHADRMLWWEALVLLRKFALQCVEVFIADSTIQAAVASWILVTAAALHLWWRPYNSPTLNRMDALSLSVSYATQALSAAYPILLLTAGGVAEAGVTVLLLGLNIGIILYMAAHAVHMNIRLFRPTAAAAAAAAAAKATAVAPVSTTATVLPLSLAATQPPHAASSVEDDHCGTSAGVPPIRASAATDYTTAGAALSAGAAHSVTVVVPAAAIPAPVASRAPISPPAAAAAAAVTAPAPAAPIIAAPSAAPTAAVPSVVVVRPALPPSPSAAIPRGGGNSAGVGRGHHESHRSHHHPHKRTTHRSAPNHRAGGAPPQHRSTARHTHHRHPHAPSSRHPTSQQAEHLG